MNAETDQQLLRDYAGSHSEPAFAELVRRHIDLVYSAALRMVCDSHLAEDVTQGVFVALAQNARQLTRHPVLSGWLHRTTQNLAANAVRTNVRRQMREQEAVLMNEMLSAEPDTNWEHIAPHLDAALGELNDSERDVILLRYFEKKSAQEMADHLGISDEAAQKRVCRAVAHLRDFLIARGVTAGASGLGVVIAANAVQAAPMGLAVTISAAAFAGTTLVTTATVTATKAIVMTTLQKTLVIVTLAAAIGTGIYEAREASNLRVQNQMLEQQRVPLTEKIEQLADDYTGATNRLARLRDENERLADSTRELLKLRGEVTRLNGDARELAQLKAVAVTAANNEPTMDAALKSWATRATQLKQRLGQMPDQAIPELQLLAEKDWFDAVKGVTQMETEADYRQALGNLRSIAKSEFAEQVRKALRQYAGANDGQLPASLAQLKSYFDGPVEDATLQRYVLLQTGKLEDVPKSQFLFAENAPPVDGKYDLFFQFRMQGFRSTPPVDKR